MCSKCFSRVEGDTLADLKPSNIKVRADGSVKVLDFGLATSTEREVSGDPARRPSRLRTGAVVAVPIVPGGAFALGPAVTVIPAGRIYAGYGSAIGGRTFDVSRDGSRFLMIKIREATAGPAFVVVQNWLAGLAPRARPR